MTAVPPASMWAVTRADWLTARVGYPPGGLRNKGKGHKKTARHIAFYALKNWPNLGGALPGHPEVAQAFGARGASTIIRCCQAVEDSPMLIRRSMRLMSEGRIMFEREYRSAILRLVACGRT